MLSETIYKINLNVKITKVVIITLINIIKYLWVFYELKMVKFSLGNLFP